MLNPFAIVLLFKLGGILASSYLSFCVYLYFNQTRHIFLPNRGRSSGLITGSITLDLPHENLWLSLETHPTGLHGWWVPHPQDPEAPVLLYFHGNRGNISSCISHIPNFQRLGFTVMLFDYRGYGLSGGQFPTEQRLYEDAETALNYLLQVRRIPHHKILVYGHSLGGAIALHAVTHLQVPLAGLVLESSFTSMEEAVLQRKSYRLLPVRWLLNQRFESINKVRSLQVPLLLIHGTHDRVVPAAMSQALFEAAPEPKHLVLIPEADHQDVAIVGADLYFQAMKDFLCHLGLRSLHDREPVTRRSYTPSS